MRIKSKRYRKPHRRLSYYAYIKIGMFERDFKFINRMKQVHGREYREMLTTILKFCMDRGTANFNKNCDDVIVVKSLNISSRIRDEMSDTAKHFNISNTEFTARLLRGFMGMMNNERLEEEIGECRDIINQLVPLGKHT